MQLTSDSFIGIPRSALVGSALLHVFLFFALLFFSTAQDGGLLGFLKPRIQKPELYQSFVQVDIVGLPDHLPTETINPLLPEVEKPESKTNTAPVEKKLVPESDIIEEAKPKKETAKKAPTKQKAEEEREKGMKEALEEAEREQALKGLSNKVGKKGRGKIKGNILSEGTSSSGIVGTAKDKYVGILTESIKQQFNVFSWQQKKGLVAEVKLVLLPNGKVKWRRIVKPSKDVLYDSAVLQAIDDAQPFPVPEDKSLLQDEITINFKP